MTSKEHWENVYATKAVDSVSWFQPHAAQSMELIRHANLGPSAAVLDVGGGASVLVDDLLDAGHTRVTVLDVSGAALVASQKRLGVRASNVQWLEADITQVELAAHAYDLWHDRAVFHFLTGPEQRRAYVQVLNHALKPGGHVVMATFADDGPLKCSGLTVMRYSATTLHAELGPEFTLEEQRREDHITPWGAVQRFVYARFRRGG